MDSVRLQRLWIRMFRLATAPGIVIHEFAHAFSCDILGASTEEVVYFQTIPDEPAGYVRYSVPSSFVRISAISLAPLFINVLAALLALEYAVAYHAGSSAVDLAVGVGLVWVAMSSIVHCIPSSQDTKAIWTATKAKFWRWPLAVISGPVHGIRLAGTRVGVYNLTLPAAAGAVIGYWMVYDIGAAQTGWCLLETAWGCWDVEPQLLRVTARLVEQV